MEILTKTALHVILIWIFIHVAIDYFLILVVGLSCLKKKNRALGQSSRPSSYWATVTLHTEMTSNLLETDLSPRVVSSFVPTSPATHTNGQVLRLPLIIFATPCQGPRMPESSRKVEKGCHPGGSQVLSTRTQSDAP